MANLEIDYKKAAQQLRSGEALFGKDGALAPMLERILNAALEGEMDAHPLLVAAESNTPLWITGSAEAVSSGYSPTSMVPP